MVDGRHCCYRAIPTSSSPTRDPVLPCSHSGSIAVVNTWRMEGNKARRQRGHVILVGHMDGSAKTSMETGRAGNRIRKDGNLGSWPAGLLPTSQVPGGSPESPKSPDEPPKRLAKRHCANRANFKSSCGWNGASGICHEFSMSGWGVQRVVRID